MPDLGWIVIPKWTEFQQYHKGKNATPRPPWIKSYTRQLHDDEYLRLSGHDRGVLHGLRLAYASSNCQLRADTASLTSRLNLRVTSDTLKRLEQAGLIAISPRKPLGLRARSQEVDLELPSLTPEGSPREKIAPPRAPTQKERVPDLLWEALIDELGVNVSELTDTGRGAINKALGQLRKVEATPEQIHDRCGVFREEWPTIRLTAPALAKQWPLLNGPRRASTPEEALRIWEEQNQ